MYKNTVDLLQSFSGSGVIVWRQKSFLPFRLFYVLIIQNGNLSLHIFHSLRSFSVGKQADLQIYRRGVNPLELLSEPECVIIGGITVRKELEHD